MERIVGYIKLTKTPEGCSIGIKTPLTKTWLSQCRSVHRLVKLLQYQKYVPNVLR